MPLGIIGATLLGSGLSTGGGLVSNLLNIRQAKKQREYEADQVAKQNAYNSPKEQMARLRAAGLNPNLVYGSSANVGNQTTIPKYERAEITNPLSNLGSELPESILKHQNIKTQQIQNQRDILLQDYQRTQNAIANQDLRTARANADVNELNALRARKLAPYTDQKQIAQSEGAVETVKSQKFVNSLNPLKRKELENSLRIQSANYDNLSQQQKNLKQDELLKREQIFFEKFKNRLADKGVTTSDNPVVRMLIEATSNLSYDSFMEKALYYLEDWLTPDYVREPRSKPWEQKK